MRLPLTFLAVIAFLTACTRPVEVELIAVHRCKLCHESFRERHDTLTIQDRSREAVEKLLKKENVSDFSQGDVRRALDLGETVLTTESYASLCRECANEDVTVKYDIAYKCSDCGQVYARDTSTKTLKRTKFGVPSNTRGVRYGSCGTLTCEKETQRLRETGGLRVTIDGVGSAVLRPSPTWTGVLCRIPIGTSLEVLESRRVRHSPMLTVTWHRVAYAGKTGWISEHVTE